jgi:pimeloyl-ACP methyl ester carboxylesterase
LPGIAFLLLAGRSGDDRPIDDVDGSESPITSGTGGRLTKLEPSEAIARAQGAELCVQAFGDPSDPAILLIQRAGAAMDWWENEFCRRLADGARFVIRYDHRDTGKSTSYPPGAPGYTGRDLANDALTVLDVVRVTRAHLVGLSMGGALSQVIALDRPDRVRSLTLIATSPASRSPNRLTAGLWPA